MRRTRLPARLTILSLLVTAMYAHGADLVDALQAARAQDPTFAAARAGHVASQEILPQARAALLPSIGLSANTQYTNSNTDFRQGGIPDSYTSHNTHSIALQAKQAIYNGQAFAAAAEAELIAKQGDLQLKGAEQELMMRVAQSYFDVLGAEDRLGLVRAQKEATAQQLALAKKSFEVGTATITDTHEAQASFDIIVAQEIAAENDLLTKQNALTQITGKPIDKLAGAGDKLITQAIDPSNLEAWIEKALAGNLDVLSKMLSKEIAVREIERNRAAHYPTLDLIATVSRNSSTQYRGFSASPNDNVSKTIMLQLQMPIFAGGALTSKSREAVAKDEQARDLLEAARSKATQDTRQSYLALTSGAAQIRALEQALISSDAAMKSTKLGQEVGVRTNLDVLNAQQKVFSTKKDLSAARYAYLLGVLRLKAVAGDLADSDFEATNQLLTRR